MCVEIYLGGNTMLELNKANFDAEVKESEKPVFIDFWSDG
jgi:thioredoxin-like negative regulator of GroEL